MRKAAKLALVLLVAAAGGLIAFAGAAPSALKSVSDVASAPEAYATHAAQLKASVRAGSVERDNGTLRFVAEDDHTRLPVVWASAKPVPSDEAGGTIEGRSVVLTGTMSRENGVWTLHATDMQVGCASKYEPAAPAA